MNASSINNSPPQSTVAERVGQDFARLEKIQSAQLAYLSEKVKTIGADCISNVDQLKRRIEELEGNASRMVSVSAFAKMKNLPVRYVRDLIAKEKLSALPVGRGRFKIEVAYATRELRAQMIKGCFWRLAHEQQERRRVDFAA